jgi:hypothetical protein
MPDALQTLVTNTTPLIALTAATGSLRVDWRADQGQVNGLPARHF